MYLGTALTPTEYYLAESGNYSNPHTSAIETILAEIVNLYPCVSQGSIIDVGCGDGVVTKTLTKMVKGPFFGIDSSDQMVSRYIKETGFPARRQEFWEEMPQGDIAIASYSLHLCPASRLPSCGAWLRHSAVRKLMIISPIKRPKIIHGFETINELYWPVGPGGSRIHLYVCKPK
jgi:SAM-dependent methyltransferase